MIFKPQRAQKAQSFRKYFLSLCVLCVLCGYFFLSCATTSVHQSIENISPQWQPFSDGIEYFQAKVSSPKINFCALKIDLSSPNVNIFVSAGSQTVSEFVKENNLIAGINAAPYDEQYNNVGLVVSDRKVLSPANKNYDALVFYREGYNLRGIIVKQDSIYSTENIENAVGGFFQILAEGEPSQRRRIQSAPTHQPDARHPRSAAGLSQDGRVLYLLIIDGRQISSVGATEMETALLLRALGSYDGINLDGGGSSTLALRFPDGEVKVVNSPGELGRERKVASCLGIK